MRFNQRAILFFRQFFQKFESNTFQEDDVATLLMYLRPVAQPNNLVWEITGFIAHTEPRNQGPFQANLDLRYSQLLYGKVFQAEWSKSLDPYKIDKKLFQALLIHGIEESSDEDLRQELGFNKNRALSILKTSYKKLSGYYYLDNRGEINNLEKIFKYVLCTFSFMTMINNDLLLKDLEYCLSITNLHLRTSYNISELLNASKDELLICLMCLIHSHEFELFDGEIGQCFLTLYKEKISDSHENNFQLILSASLQINTNCIQWPLMEVNNIERFIPNLSDLDLKENKFNVLEKFNAIRDSSGNLIIDRK